MTMSDAEFDTFVESSKAALQVKQDALESRFNLGHYASWSYDSSDSSLCLADDSGCVRMKADVYSNWLILSRKMHLGMGMGKSFIASHSA